MMIARWKPPVAPTRQERFLLQRLGRVRKLFAFLRLHRHEVFEESFQDELGSMYRRTGAGKPPLPPGLLAMATLVQGYLGVSDAEMVELTLVDLRVQMVLGCLGAETPPFSQGALQEFRERLIAGDMDRRLLERTVEVAKRTKAFDYRKLPKTLRVAIDSSPLEGAGRVEDTYNLLAHAARHVVRCAAGLLAWPTDKVCREAGIPVLRGASVKAALDVDWNDAEAKAGALTTLVRQLDALQAWVAHRLPEELAKPPLQTHLDTLRQIRAQDLEPDPVGSGVRIRQGVAADRRIAITDPAMRHGRKSKTKRFNGFKRHIAADVDRGLILACALTPANRPEEEAIPALRRDLARLHLPVDELLIDRGYINSPLVDEVLRRRGKIVCKPWQSHNGGLFPKSAFTSGGRAALRERTMIEHKLAHIAQRQGNQARYVGVRKNTFDLRRASAIQNLETLHRAEIAARNAA